MSRTATGPKNAPAGSNRVEPEGPVHVGEVDPEQANLRPG